MDIDAVVLRAIDRCMRYMQHADSEDAKTNPDDMPYVFQIHFPDKSPFHKAARDLYDMTRPDGDLTFVVELFWLTTEMDKDTFWNRYMSLALTLALN